MVKAKQKLSCEVGRPIARLDHDVLVQMYVTSNLSTRAVAARLGVSHQTVARRLKEHQIPAKRWQVPGSNKTI